jgi:branched-chain amino acid transport system permease protein
MNHWYTSNEALIQAALASTLLAYSFQVALRAGVSSFAGVGFWAIGAYTTANLVRDHGWGTAPAIAVALALCALVGLGLGLILGRLRSLYLAMATVAFVVLVQTVSRIWEAVTGGAVGLYAIPVTIDTGALTIIVALTAALLWRMERGTSGRALETLRLDEQLAPSLGIDVRRTHIRAFTLSAVLGGLSGGCYALMFNIVSPGQAGFPLIVTTLMMIVIGGTSSWIGPVLGAFIVTWLPTWLSFAEGWRPALQGLLVLLMVVHARDGIVGLARTLVRHGRALPALLPPRRRPQTETGA